MKNWEEMTVCWLLDIFWFLEFGLGVLVNHCRGHRVVGGFGLGGQESSWNPGAREPDKLLLAGREENSVLGTISAWTQF